MHKDFGGQPALDDCAQGRRAEFLGDNNMARARNSDAIGQRRIPEICVEKRDDHANAVQPQPDRDISARFPIIRQTASPIRRFCAIAQRAYWLERAASSPKLKLSCSEMRAAASPRRAATSSNSIARMRRGSSSTCAVF